MTSATTELWQHADRHRGSAALRRMVEYAPATGGLALWARHRDIDAETPLIATDGRTIRYGTRFDRSDLEEQTGLVAHAVLHLVLRHPQRMRALEPLIGDVDAELFTICADAIVNSSLGHLTWLRLPAGSVTLDRLLAATLGIAQPVERSLLEWDVERLYRAIDDRVEARGRARSETARTRDPHGDGESGGRKTRRPDGPRAAEARVLGAEAMRDLVRPDDAHATSAAPEDAAEAERQWGERIARAHAGDGAFSMLRTMIADVPRPNIPWRQMLRTLSRRALAPQPTPSWSRPARSYLANQGRTRWGHRLPFEPGTAASRAVPRLVVMVDISGSIDGPVLDRFATEVEAVTRLNGAELTVILGDDRLRAVERAGPGRPTLREIVFQGGGGTDFTPLLEEAERHRPDLGIVLTDLAGPARHKPDWPVLWAVPPESAHRPQPFGRKLVID